MWRLRTDGEVKPTVHHGFLHGPIPTIEPEALLRTRTEAHVIFINVARPSSLKVTGGWGLTLESEAECR
jgi:hypothetical protein